MDNIIEITDFSAKELDVYARLTEAQLLNMDGTENGLFIAESPKVIMRALDAGYEPVSVLAEDRHIGGEAGELIARCSGVPVYTAPFDVLARLTGYKLIRGALCVMRRNRCAMRKISAGEPAHCRAGKCDESHECRSYYPFRRSFKYGCGSAYAGVQQSVIPEGDTCQHGYGISDPLDVSSGKGDRKVGRRAVCNT